MALESSNYVAGLIATNPTATDPKSQGDDHLRLIKQTLLNSFAGFPGMVIVTGAEAQGATASDYTVTVSPAQAAYTASMLLVFKATHANTGAATVQIGALGTKPLVAVDGSALKAGDIEAGGVVAAFYDGTSFYLVSGNDRANRNGDSYSGTHDFTGAALRATTKPYGSGGDEVATVDYVNQASFQPVLPGQAGHAGKFLGTNGMAAAWSVVSPVSNIEVLSTSGTWVCPANVLKARVTVVGGGGSASNRISQSGSGGGGGGCAIKVAAVTPGQAYTVTVGAGGAGLAATGANTTGNDGGTSSFSGLDVAAISGGGGKAGGMGVGGVGGVGTGGNINIPGGVGTASATNSNTPPALGGGSYLAGSVPDGTAGGYGAGSGGRWNNAGSSSGSNGVVILEY